MLITGPGCSRCLSTKKCRRGTRQLPENWAQEDANRSCMPSGIPINAILSPLALLKGGPAS